MYIGRTLLRPAQRMLASNGAHTIRPPSYLRKASPPLVGHFRATRHYSSYSTADELIEEIQELYATAKDEFEIAHEETEKISVYAEDDRKAAREELDKLQELYSKALGGQHGEEIKARGIGNRIRELSSAVEAMEELAQNQD